MNERGAPASECLFPGQLPPAGFKDEPRHQQTALQKAPHRRGLAPLPLSTTSKSFRSRCEQKCDDCAFNVLSVERDASTRNER